MNLKKLLPLLLATLLLTACGQNKQPYDDWEPPITTGPTLPTEAEPTEPESTDPSEPEPTVPTGPEPTDPQPTDPSEPEEFNPPEEEHSHRFGSWKVGKKATCIKEGYKVRSCDCGEVETKPYFGEHSFGEWVTQVESTCTETGIEIRSCTECNAEEKTIKPLQKHDQVVTPGTPATCTEGGIADYIYCASCETVLQEATALEPTGHKPVTHPEKPATCTDFGLTSYENCEYCGEFYQMPQVIQRLGHDLTDGACSRCEHTCDHGVDPLNPGLAGQNEQQTGSGEVLAGTELVYQEVTCDQCGEVSKIVNSTAQSPDEPETEDPATD